MVITNVMHWPQLGNSPEKPEESVYRFSISKTPICTVYSLQLGIHYRISA